MSSRVVGKSSSGEGAVILREKEASSVSGVGRETSVLGRSAILYLRWGRGQRP